MSMRQAYCIAEKLFAAFGLVVFCFIIWIAVISTWKIPLHNYRLHILQKHFRETTSPFHPVQSELLVEMAEFGNFGQSNHCDYQVGEFRSSPLSREEVARVYANTGVLSFDTTSHLPTEIYFAEELSNAERWWPWDEWLQKYIHGRSLVPGENDENIYLVFVASNMHPPDGDIRCH